MKGSRDDIPEDPEEAAKLAALKQLKRDLDSAMMAGNVLAIQGLLSQLSAFPVDLLNQLNLSIESIKAECDARVAEVQAITDTKADLPAQELTYGEKAAEQALGNIISVNNMLEAYLNNAEVTASRERNKRWVAQPGSVDAVAFVADREKIKPKRDIVARAYLETDFDPEVMKLARSKLVSELGETHEEVRKFDARKAAELNRSIKAGTQIKEDLSDDTKLLREAAVEKVMGKEKAAAAVRENNVQVDALDQKLQGLMAQRDELLAPRKEVRAEAKARKALDTESHASKEPDFDEEAIKKATSQSVADVAPETPKEVRKSDTGIDEALSKTIELGSKLKEEIDNEKQLLKDPKVEEVLEKEKTEAADKENEAQKAAAQQKKAKREAMRAKLKTELSAKSKESSSNTTEKSSDSQLSPAPTPPTPGKQGPPSRSPME